MVWERGRRKSDWGPQQFPNAKCQLPIGFRIRSHTIGNWKSFDRLRTGRHLEFVGGCPVRRGRRLEPVWAFQGLTGADPVPSASIESLRSSSRSSTVFTACGSLGIADQAGSNPDSLGSAILPTPISGTWITRNSRLARLKPGDPWVCKSPRANHVPVV